MSVYRTIGPLVSDACYKIYMIFMLCRHWIAVFGIVFPRPLAQNIDYLVQNLKEEKGRLSMSCCK